MPLAENTLLVTAWARYAARGRLPPCELPTCRKTAPYVLELYLDLDYRQKHAELGRETAAFEQDFVAHTVAEWERYRGRPHCYRILNVCSSCLAGLVRLLTQEQTWDKSVEYVDRLRDAKGRETLLTYLRYGSSASYVAFCRRSLDVQSCLREVEVAMKAGNINKNKKRHG